MAQNKLGSLFASKEILRVRGILLGERIDLKSLELAEKWAQTPLVVPAGAHGCAVLFRYGAAVLFELDAMEQAQFLVDLKKWVLEPFKDAESETAEIQIHKSDEMSEGIGENGIHVKELDIERIQIIADVFAKSMVLGYYESQIAGAFDSIEPIVASLQNKKRQYFSGYKLQQYIGQILLIHHKMVQSH